MSGFNLNSEQQIAANTLAGRVLVTAGAGSGKTRVLTERAVNAVRPGSVAGWQSVNIDQILAITYTEKAAGELAERIRGTLRLDGFEDQARMVDAAWISTIHGMCARIVRAEALEAGIDPSFRVLETVETGELKEQALEIAVQRLLEEKDRSRLLELFDFPAVATTIFTFAEDLRNRDRRAGEFAPTLTESVQGLAEEAVWFFREKSAFFETCGLDTDAVRDHGTACALTVETLSRLLIAEMEPDELAEAVWRTLVSHELKRTYKGVKDEVSSIKQMRFELCARLAAVITAPVLVEFVALTEMYQEAFAALKGEVGGLDFSDLQIETRRLLRRPEVLQRWQERFALVMVDEFQDTDGLQLEIVEALAEENFCTVGDERQSIYRFRGADVDVYRAHNEAMASQGAAPAVLSRNYRSHPAVLGFVNGLFGRPELFGDRLVPLGHGRDEPDCPVLPLGVPRVEVMLAPLDGGKGTDAARRDLAKEIATRISALHTDNGISLRDVVILVPTYTHAHKYASALASAGLEAVVVGGSRFFDQREVIALRTALKVVANRLDEAATAELLASDLCGISDDGFIELRRHFDDQRFGMWAALEVARLSKDDRARVDALLRAVNRATASLGRTGLAETILRLVEDCGLDLRMLASGLEGSQAYANVLKFARLASSFEQAQGSGPTAFLAYLDAKELFGDREVPAALTGDDSAAVRIMSIHASKGLEFPVVVVPELEARGRNDSFVARWSKDQGASLAMALPSNWTSASKKELRSPPLFQELRDHETSAEEEERKRLFYVACTRARELLVLAGAQTTGSSSATTMLNWLTGALGISIEPDSAMSVNVDGETSVSVRVLPIAATTDAVVQPSEHEQDGREDNERWFSVLRFDDSAAVSDTDAPQRLSYSGVSLYKQCALRFKAENILGLDVSIQAAGPAVRRGSALHTLLQVSGEDSLPDQSRMDAVCRYYRLDVADVRRVKQALDSYRGSSVAHEVRNAVSVSREAPFALWVGDPGLGFVLDGTIDVYARCADKALVVDYKTGETACSSEALHEQFGLQARCYALAAVRDGAEIVDAVFVRPEALVDGQPQETRFRFTRNDAEGFAQELLALHAEMRKGVWRPRAEWDDRVCGRCSVLPQMCALKAGQAMSRLEAYEPAADR